MPTYEHQDEKSLSNPQPLIGIEALSKLTPPQGDAMLLRVIENLASQVMRLENRMKYLEKYETNTHPPVRTVTGDAEFIKVSQNEEHVLIGFDEEELRRHFPPPLLPTYLDRYRHCTDPTANPDLFLPSGIADGQISNDGVLVVQLGFDTGKQDCYYIIERNVLGTPTPYSTVTKIDDCTECDYMPPTDPPCESPPCDPPDGDYPYLDGWVVSDFDCWIKPDGALAIDVKYINLQTGAIKIETKLNCCCATDAPYDPPDTVAMDRWRPCDAGGDASQDIFLEPEIYDFFGGVDPIIQLNGAGCCYQFIGETADETLTEDAVISQVATCADEDCDACPPALDADCGDSSSETAQPNVTLVNTNLSDVNTTSIINDKGPYTWGSYSDTGATCQWLWNGNATPPQYNFVLIKTKATGVFTAHIFNPSSQVIMGDFLTQAPTCATGIPKVVTGIKNVGGIVTGSFTLDSEFPGGAGCTTAQHTAVNVTLG